MNIGGKNMNSKEFAELMWLYRNNSITKPVLERHVLAELMDVYLKAKFQGVQTAADCGMEDIVNVISKVYPMK